jgi:hypothetical protein
MGDGRLYRLWILFSDRDVVKTAYNRYIWHLLIVLFYDDGDLRMLGFSNALFMKIGYIFKKI